MKIKPPTRAGSLGRRALITASVIVLAGCTQDSDRVSESPPNAVPFEISCGTDTQSGFADAVTLLHSFEYVETSKRFETLIDQEPSCAMTYWGAAMSIWHPLWAAAKPGAFAAGRRLFDPDRRSRKERQGNCFDRCVEGVFLKHGFDIP